MSLQPSIPPEKLKSLHFRFLRIGWSLYRVDHPKVKGVIRLLAVPAAIFELPRELTTSQKPIYVAQLQGVVSFVNEGEKGPPSQKAFTQADYEVSMKEDITDSVVPEDEPINYYLIEGSPPVTVSMRTVMVKVELISGLYNQFGDPILNVIHNTTPPVVSGAFSGIIP